MRNVLIIEDDFEIVNLINTFFKGSDVTVDHIANGSDGLDLILDDHEKYDAILVDRVLPGIEGIDLIKKVKAHKSNILTPIVMVTSSSKDDQVSQGINAGAFYYLIKPIRKKSFLTIMNKTFEFIDNERKGVKYFNSFIRGNYLIDSLKASMSNHREALDLSFTLSFHFSNPSRAFRGILELLTNSIEHGIYEIGEQKSELIANDTYESTLDSKQSELTSEKKIDILIKKNKHFTEIEIQDPGDGFDWQNYLSLDPANSNKESGKGIAYANQVCFDDLSFNKKGNVVVAKMNNEILVA